MTGQTKSTNAKRPYAPPRLVVHGTVATITAFVTGGPTDGKGGSAITPG
jgi:hypothetical protein